jgi:Domain of unknown function (DUF4136)
VEENGERARAGILFVLLVCGGVRAQDVTTNSMPGMNFANDHTYQWPNQIVDTQIKNSIDSQLSAKGLTKTDTDKADLYVAYQISMDQERQWNAYGMGGGCVGEAEWPPRKAPPSALGLWFWTCTTPRPNSSFGRDASRRRLIRATVRKRNRRIWTRLCKSS